MTEEVIHLGNETIKEEIMQADHHNKILKCMNNDYKVYTVWQKKERFLVIKLLQDCQKFITVEISTERLVFQSALKILLSLVPADSQISFNQRTVGNSIDGPIDPHEPNKVELKRGDVENALKTAPISKPEEIFDLTSFNRYRYRNIFNVRY